MREQSEFISDVIHFPSLLSLSLFPSRRPFLSSHRLQPNSFSWQTDTKCSESSACSIGDRVLINVDTPISVTRVNDIVIVDAIECNVGSRLDLCVCLGSLPYLFLSFQPSLPSPFPRPTIFSLPIIAFLSLSHPPLSPSRSPSPLCACVRVGAWIGGRIERTYTNSQSVARVGSPFFLSACLTRAP